ncbi:MAG: CvpA family protein [Cellvibrionaceae bacterium]
MNWADFAILGILVVSGLISLKRGFVKEALSLAGWVAAFIIAMLFGSSLETLFVDNISSPSIRKIVAFAILFVSTLIVAGLVNYLIGELVKITGLSGTDRLLGMIFGFIRGVIIIMAMLLLLPAIVPLDKEMWWQQSVLIPQFLSMEGWCREVSGVVFEYIKSLF